MKTIQSNLSEIEGDIWRIPGTRTKNNKTHEVDLCPLALEILNDVPAMGDLLFSTNNRTAPSDFSVAKKRLDKILPNLQPWRLHDIRISAASRMSALGILPIVVGHVLNHVSGERGGLVGVYQQYSYRPERKEALFKWGEHIQVLISGVSEQKPKQITL